MAVDLISLLIGIAVATILWWVITRARPLWRQLRDNAHLQREAARERRMSDIEAAHRRIVLRRAQGMHLAAPLFPLDEILEEPLLLAPPARVIPEATAASEDAVTMTVPYMPAWPELAATYEAPVLTLGEALAGGVPLVLIGQPGIGKTVALAHLATLAANRSPALGSVSEQVPFLVHVSELKLPVTERKELLYGIIESSASSVSVLDWGRIEKFAQACFQRGRALLLVDGFDELTESGQHAVTDFFGQILNEFPGSRIVTTGAPEFLDGLFSLGFVPLTVVPWNRRRQVHFIGRWIELWTRSIGRESTPH
jgi:hypothetical protein